MSRLKEIAALIPAEYRKEILELNMIDQAQAVGSDATMQYLGVIWKNYVEPDFSPDCNLCYGRVLENFRNLKKILIELEKQDKLLNSA